MPTLITSYISHKVTCRIKNTQLKRHSYPERTRILEILALKLERQLLDDLLGFVNLILTGCKPTTATSKNHVLKTTNTHTDSLPGVKRNSSEVWHPVSTILMQKEKEQSLMHRKRERKRDRIDRLTFGCFFVFEFAKIVSERQVDNVEAGRNSLDITLIQLLSLKTK